MDLKYDFKNYKYDYFYRFTEILECIPVDNKELNFNQKIMQIKIIKDNLSQLKQGKLVNFNL